MLSLPGNLSSSGIGKRRSRNARSSSRGRRQRDSEATEGQQKAEKLASAGKDLETFPLLKVRRRTLTCLTDSHAFLRHATALATRVVSFVHLSACDSHLLINSQALAQREEAVRNGKLTTIIFIRDLNAKKQEVSGYIDYAQ